MNIPRNIYKITPISNEKEWRYIQKFKQRAKEFIVIRDKYTPEIITAHINRLPNGKFTGNANTPKEEELKEIYMAFRFFYHTKEITNFNTILDIVIKYSQQMPEEITKYLNTLKQGWDKALLETDDSDFFEREIRMEQYIKLWFNAHYFHSDLDKEEKLQELNDFLSEPISKHKLFITVFLAGAYVGLLYRTIENLSESNWEISIPMYD